MAKPVVGVIGNRHIIENRFDAQLTGEKNMQALAHVCGALPLMFTGDPNITDINALLDTVDGILLTGARANVHPEEYGEAATEAHGTFDRGRDTVALPLIRALVDRGQPFLGICRGFQEVNVAMGGSLYPEIRDLPGRMNHRMPPDGTIEEKFALRHSVTFSEGGPFHELFGATKVMTNTLHGQGIKTAGARVIIDGYADDGTPEATFIKDAPGFSLSVQWHPEYRAATDPVSRPLFEGFGDAVREWAAG